MAVLKLGSSVQSLLVHDVVVVAGTERIGTRLADRATLEREVAAWQAARNRAGRGVNWRFTTEDARIKLKHLYPTTQG